MGRVSAGFPADGLAQDLQFDIHVFRAAVVSIVLALAVGPYASLLCAAGCHPQGASPAPCEHTDPSRTLRLVPIDSCPDFFTRETALVREDARRAASPHAQPAIATPLFAVAVPIGPAKMTRLRARSSLEARPLAIALRI